eukprot:2730579-Prymnesium_polylepis.1
MKATHNASDLAVACARYFTLWRTANTGPPEEARPSGQPIWVDASRSTVQSKQGEPGAAHRARDPRGQTPHGRA